MCLSCEDETIPEGRVTKNSVVERDPACHDDDHSAQKEEKLETSNNKNLIPSISHTKVDKKSSLIPKVILGNLDTGGELEEPAIKDDKPAQVCKHYKIISANLGSVARTVHFCIQRGVKNL